MKNNRTFLEKLLDGAEVKWIPLGDVADYEQPTKYLVNSTVYNDNYPTPVLTAGKTFILGYTNEDEGIYFASKSPVIIFDDFTTANKWVDFDFKAKSSAMKMITSKNEKFALLKYIYYWLNTLPNNQTDGDHKRQWISNYANKLIPIPPLPVQTEIVKILDALTALTSELTSELILRQKQYEYYREKLLSEEELGKVGFKWKTLEELVEKTQNIRWKNNTKIYRYIDLTSVDRENNNIIGTIEINALNAPSRAQKIVKENDVIFATTRPTQQRVALISKEFSDEIASTGYCVLRAKTNIVLPKWLFYFLSTINFKNYVEENQSGSAYPAISDSKVKEFRIPIPEVTIQQSIIEKLDKFYSLTNSLLHGLPKEINNRKKQYSYYQKELLNFLGGNIYE
jgi:putative type I restriction enzyme ecoR124II specificity protein